MYINIGGSCKIEKIKMKKRRYPEYIKNIFIPRINS